MLVLPLPNDVIETKDGAKLTVVGFNNFKSKGPAVYCRNGDEPAFLTIYFFDIEKINDVRVEFSTSIKVFNALGRIKRKIHLPQPHDIISVFDKSEEHSDKDSFSDSKKVKVAGYKLHSKKYGVSKGLLVEDEDRNVYMLDEILDLKRDTGTTVFDRKTFLKLYKEYTGHRA